MEKNIGTLSDEEIIFYCSRNKLIEENFEKNNVKQACYELRASNIYYDLAENAKKYEIAENDYILLKPKQQIVLITKEKLSLPNDILGRILTKGKLFSIGILPVNTYADPGFYGELGIVLFNVSNNYLKIKPLGTIAKIEFTRLSKPVNKPYHGQHGYQTQIWPIPIDMILTKEEIGKDKRIQSNPIELEKTYGRNFASVIKRVYIFERKLILSVSLYLLFILLLILFNQKNINLLSVTGTILIGIVANIITTMLLYFATNLKKE